MIFAIFLPIVIFALVGLYAALIAAFRTKTYLKAAAASKPRLVHSQAIRRPAEGTPLLDEPPPMCPKCDLPVVVARGPFKPENGDVLPRIEFFRCRNGHDSMGPNQSALVEQRRQARQRLKAVAIINNRVVTELVTEIPPPVAVDPPKALRRAPDWEPCNDLGCEICKQYLSHPK